MENEEIDLIEVAVKLWRKRMSILCFIAFFLIAGVLIAFLSPRKYTAQCILGLETKDPITRISVEGTSVFNSMNVGDIKRSNIVSPKMYPDIIFSAPFQKELIYLPLFVNEQGDSVTFYSYYINTENRNGIYKAQQKRGVELLTEEENKCLVYLKTVITVVNGKYNDLTIIVESEDAKIAAQLTYRIQVLLQNYITKFKTAKAQSALEFIEERCQDVKNDLEKRQQILIAFRENNLKINSIRLKTEEDILKNDYELFFDLYSSLVKQRETARIQVKEEMSELVVIESVVEPRAPSSPKRAMILIAFSFLGLFVGCGWVLISSYYKSMTNLRK